MERTAKYSRLTTLAASVIVIAVLYLAKGVLIPFALAMLVSFLLAPLVLRLQRWHVNRVVAVVTAVGLVLVLTSAMGWLVVGQVRDVTTNLSEYRHNIHARMDPLRGALTKPVQTATKIVKDLGDDLAASDEPAPRAPQMQTVRIAEPELGPFEALRDMLGPAVDMLMTAAMALLFAFMMLLRRDDLGDRFMRIVGYGNILVTTRALQEATKRVSVYLWRLLLLNGLHGLVIGCGLALIGVPNAPLWGLMSAVLRFIPYIGPWVGAAFPILTSLAVSSGWSEPLLTIGLFVTLELISNNLLEPWIYGTGTGISPLAILISAMFWTWLWGPVGLVLSTPLTVCLVVMGKHVPQLQFLPWLFGDAPGLSPPARLYQRLIVGDQDQAWSVLEAELETKELHEVYDTVLLPALSMAEYDRQHGALDELAESRIEETVKLLIEEAGDSSVPKPASTDLGRATMAARPLRVLCVPARDTGDAQAAILLRQVLERVGLRVEVSSLAKLWEDCRRLSESGELDLVCISAVPPSRFIHVRQLCKRIAARFPEVPIVAGMWTIELEPKELADRLLPPDGVHVVTSLAEALAHVRKLAETEPIQREAPGGEVVAASA